MIKLLTAFFVIAMLVVGAAFAALNAESVALHYYFGEVNMPVALLIALSLSVGALLGIMASSGLLLRSELRNRGLRRQVSLAEEEVANLRTLPLQDT